VVAWHEWRTAALGCPRNDRVRSQPRLCLWRPSDLDRKGIEDIHECWLPSNSIFERLSFPLPPIVPSFPLLRVQLTSEHKTQQCLRFLMLIRDGVSPVTVQHIIDDPFRSFRSVFTSDGLAPQSLKPPAVNLAAFQEFDGDCRSRKFFYETNSCETKRTCTDLT
jgi:hypothetical protein